MKADVWQQHSLLELVEIDAELNRIAHRAANLSEQQRCEQLEAGHRTAVDRVAVLAIAIEDLDGQVGRLESEIDGVRQREDRDRALLDSPATNSKQLSELQHELETLQRRQGSLEDSLLEVMERREQLQGEQSAGQSAVDGLAEELTAARQARDAALAEIEQTRGDRVTRRAQVSETVAPELASLYERVGPARCRGGAVGRAASRSTAANCRASPQRLKTTCCVARNVARSCCGSLGLAREGGDGGRRRFAGAIRGRGRPGTGPWCSRPITARCSPKASRPSGGPPTTSPNTAAS